MRTWIVAGTITAVLCVGLIVAQGCGEDNGTSRNELAHKAVPTFYVKNYIERQLFNRRLELTDDPATVLFCTAFPFDAEPYTVPIAGKLVSGNKRPDPKEGYETNENYGYERPDAQGMYGDSVPYRFGFTPGGVYEDFTDIPTVCQTQAVNFRKTSIGLVAVTNAALTQAGRDAEATLRAGLTHNAEGHFSGYSTAAQKKAQEILDRATSGSTVASAGKGAQ